MSTLKKAIIVDPILCTGCLECELVCSLAKTGVVNPANSRIKITKIKEEGVYLPVVCQHCEKAPCESACPTRARTRDPKTGAIVLDQDLCIGCKICLTACPFGATQLSAEGEVIQCDLCGGDPKCVQYCNPRPENSSAFMSNPKASALRFVEPSEATVTKRRIQINRLQMK
jgi:carbon-monoxide dehydrogenase iron sulfur subunit